ncbi:MAG: 2-oxoacid:acceptor oxidoreductase family protein, partial [Alphaproteobacteria bacterium]|nr:2-oxoacid:acceptor oxidoreductase family protein [Alphaproteobacteria bacterium]
TLFSAIDIFAGLREDGYLLVNTAKTMDELGIGEAVKKLPAGNVAAVPATDLAMRHLKRPTPNTVLLGAFTAMSDIVQIDSVFKAIERKFPGKVGDMNIAAAQAAYDTARAD